MLNFICWDQWSLDFVRSGPSIPTCTAVTHSICVSWAFLLCGLCSASTLHKYLTWLGVALENSTALAEIYKNSSSSSSFCATGVVAAFPIVVVDVVVVRVQRITAYSIVVVVEVVVVVVMAVCGWLQVPAEFKMWTYGLWRWSAEISRHGHFRSRQAHCPWKPAPDYGKLGTHNSAPHFRFRCIYSC